MAAANNSERGPKVFEYQNTAEAAAAGLVAEGGNKLFVEEFGEGWAICEVDEDGEEVRWL